jgi:argininosuccinate lyase
MSAIATPAQAVAARSLRASRKLIVLALVSALATAAILVAVAASGSSAPGSTHTPTAQPQFFGGHAEGRVVQPASSPTPANDGSQHSGARP